MPIKRKIHNNKSLNPARKKAKLPVVRRKSLKLSEEQQKRFRVLETIQKDMNTNANRKGIKPFKEVQTLIDRKNTYIGRVKQGRLKLESLKTNRMKSLFSKRELHLIEEILNEFEKNKRKK
jgi:hypothetical protein